jgi:signal transduction histidine kinase
MDANSRTEMTATPAATPAPPLRFRARPLIRSAGVRFALIYAVVFGLSAFTLVIYLYSTTTKLLTDQLQDAGMRDAAALIDHYEIGGLPDLLEAINDRVADSDNDSIYLLRDALGNRMAGNLTGWPAPIDQTGVWYKSPVVWRNATVTAYLRAFALPGGFQLLVGRNQQTDPQLHDFLGEGLVWVLGLMMALGALGAFIIRSVFRRMVQDIATTTRAIARGDLSRRIAETGDGDEFDELAQIINDMLDRIGRLMDGVRQVSNSIAHDLRTPITRARTRLEDASLRANSPEDLRSAIDRATADLDGIVAVFEALLRIAEIEAGSRRAAFAAFDLAPLLNDIDELYRAVAEERNLALDTRIATCLPVLGDRELLQQAVTNLLDNALKFSPAGSVVSLTARLADAMIEIRIADRGAGISEADRARATERFFRAESARSTSGSGLGLALVAAVAQLHNGSLQLVDHHPGLIAIIAVPARLDLLTAPAGA